MKRLMLVLAAITVLVATGFSKEKGYAQATFPVQKYDFGIIKESKGPVSTSFEFVNTGTEPLIIVEAVASCGCTRPEYPKRPIAPGKKGQIKVTYSPIGRLGGFDKNIKVKTNGREKRTTLVIQGSVVK